MISDFERECDKWDAPKAFRIHWDGDFFNQEYTNAWREVILAHPNTRFWVYTRVVSAIRTLAGIDNLALYFSTDSDNIASVPYVLSTGAKLAMLSDTFGDAKDALAEVGERGAKCPEQRKQVALEGACVSCGICPKGNANITFSITKK
jgi:hypothetical protein